MLMRCAALMLLAATLAACAPSHDGELLWRFKIKKAHRQWAVADEQRLYLCADDVYCLDITTGRLLWEFKTFGTLASAPVVANGRLFFQCGGLYALDTATGSLLWEFWTNDWASSAPVVGGGRVYALAGKHLYCLDAADGKRLWSFETGSGADSLVMIDDRLCIGTGSRILCFDGSSGARLWVYWIGGERIQLTRAGDFLVSVGSEGLVRSHSAATGDVQWQRATNFPLVQIAVACTDCLLVSAGTLSCVNPETGNSLWTFNQDTLAVREAHILDQYVLARTFRNELLCIARNDGSLIRRMVLSADGRLLTDGTGAVFFPGGRSRTVSCIFVSVL
jgi:outer membrane protein assembly factor BamB